VTSKDLEFPRTASVESSHGGSETCGGFLRRPASFSTGLNRLELAEEADQGRDECRWPTLPEWPEMDLAAFERGKALLGSMEMDPASFSRNVLCHLALEIFQAAGLPEELAADVGRVQRFILAVRESMYDNAYHNFYHVFDVTQTVSVLSRRSGTLDRLNAWERFALLAAALCHGAPSPPTPSIPTLNWHLPWACYLIKEDFSPPRCAVCSRARLAVRADLEHPGVTSVFMEKAGSTVAGAFKDTVRPHPIPAHPEPCI